MFLLHYQAMFKKSFWSISNPVSIIFFFLLAQTLLVGLNGVSKDPGLGWHIKTGEWILENHSIPYLDPFLSIARSWVSDQWLSDIFFYIVYESGGFLALVLLVISIFFITVFYLHTDRLVKLSGSFLSAAVSSLFCFRLMQIHLISRPVVFSFLLFTIVAWEVSKWEQGKKGSFWLVLLFLLWANVHPSFVLGIVLVAFGVVLSKFRELKLGITCGLVTFINPYGYKLHESILWLGRSDFFMSLHQEWRSPSEEHWFYLVFLFLFGVIPGLVLFRKRLGLFWIINSALFLYFSLKAVRFMPYFGILVSVPLSCTMSWYVWRFRKARLIVQFLLLLERYARKADYRQVVPATLILLWVVGIFTKSLPFSGRTELGPPKEKFPYGVIDIIPDGDIVAATPDWGGFLILHNKRPVIDDRNTLIGEEFYKTYLEAEKGLDTFKEWARQNNAKWLLVSSKKTDNYRGHVYRDDVVSLFEIVP